MAYESEDPMPEARASAMPPDASRAGLPPQGAARRRSERTGDDDPSPPAPSDETWRAIVEARGRRMAETAGPMPSDGKREERMPEEPSDGRIGRFVWYSAMALVALLVCHLLSVPVRSLLQARTRAEFVFACVLLAVTVGVFVTIVWRAWALFAGHPKVLAICESDYGDRPTELARRIREDYVNGLRARRDRYAKSLGLADGDAPMVALDKLGRDCFPTSTAYVAAFREFQRLQDGLAAKIVRRYALRIAAKTAISPWRIIDMLAVAYNSTVMICQIARVYDRRVSRPQALKLLLRWAFNLYVSGELGEIMSSSAEGLEGYLHDLFGENGPAAMLQPFLPMLSKIVGKSAEGGINAYNACRFGRKAIAAFRYLHEKKVGGEARP